MVPRIGYALIMVPFFSRVKKYRLDSYVAVIKSSSYVLFWICQTGASTKRETRDDRISPAPNRIPEVLSSDR